MCTPFSKLTWNHLWILPNLGMLFKYICLLFLVYDKDLGLGPLMLFLLKFPNRECNCNWKREENDIQRVQRSNNLNFITTLDHCQLNLFDNVIKNFLLHYLLMLVLLSPIHTGSNQRWKKLLVEPFKEEIFQLSHYKMVQLRAFFSADLRLCETPFSLF